ncbi:MAG TPA: DUF262 domain-containing protein [Candidatus Thiothrix moscowensis]|uniref:DUF262 domain-containing protein n=1 Tax=unclassified Thiothrix TaxID=2636184 RepID=UPI0025FEDD81|nr:MULTISPECIES: DUF262 domain-containing protein [unclassified Thiothrix]HRJ54594.1 DUF262 domain-containing protein [Candidatus Thiothrix moscowensis]HRJ94968.1 DUF262 domain-containing protein [Candidatus Thiothrix moscowensis]
MSDASTEALKSISALLQNDSTFFIPSYQRGYRWKNEQVTQLLDDIKEFTDNLIDKKLEEKPDENYYCLQPLVVNAPENTDEKGKWEVIDGQQRLTTIYLILHYLKINNKLTDKCKEQLNNKFEIRYKTREGEGHNSHKFLTEIHEKSSEEAEKNVDYLFMFNAYKAIKDWFMKNKTLDCNVFLNNIKFIWHDIKKEDSREVFTRINTGKIPLSNAELIKALFLQRKNFAGYEQTIQRKQLEIAMEWDKIEYTLQNDEFWYFLNKEKCQSPTKIEFIFDLISKKTDSKDKDHAFRHFYNKELKDKKGDDLYKAISKLWKEVRDYYLTFVDWYNDIELYHYIGFLTHAGTISLQEKHEDYINIRNTKHKFKESLKTNIIEKIKKIDPLSLRYGENNEGLKNSLLLFNILQNYTPDNGGDFLRGRFPFFLYMKHNWHIEHIYPQTPENIKTVKDWKDRLEMQCDVLERIKKKDYHNQDSEKLESMIKMLSSTVKALENDYIEKTKQESLNYTEPKAIEDPEKITQYKQLDNNAMELLGFDIHSIENLALLDSSTNQSGSVSNKNFKQKSQEIVTLYKTGVNKKREPVFILPCTFMTFLKAFTNEPEQFHYWSKQDADDYVTTIKKTLKDYLPEKTTTEEQI